MDEKMGLSHQIMLYNREKGNLTGILDVISFDENTKQGDIIEIQFGTKSVKVEVLDVQETVRKDDVKELYRYL